MDAQTILIEAVEGMLTKMRYGLVVRRKLSEFEHKSDLISVFTENNDKEQPLLPRSGEG